MVNQRMEMARQVLPGYAQNPKVATVVVSGSVARGWADRFSDVELDVYWHQPPTEADRLRPIAQCRGELIVLEPFADNEWSEEYTVDGLQMDISSFLVTTIETVLDNVLVGGDTAVLKQLRLAGIHHGIPLFGEPIVQQWQARTRTYPDHLQQAMVQKHLLHPHIGIWYLQQALLAREDWLMLNQILVEMATRILGTLLALNRTYLAHPDFKWMRETAVSMTIKPPHLEDRLSQIFLQPPPDAIQTTHQLLLDTLALVEKHLPQLDVAGTRTAVNRLRRPWKK